MYEINIELFVCEGELHGQYVWVYMHACACIILYKIICIYIYNVYACECYIAIGLTRV